MGWKEYNKKDFCRYDVAPTVAGEIASAVSVIFGRWYHDRFKLALDGGCEYVDFAARYLYDVCDGTEVTDNLDILWGLQDDEAYGRGVEKLSQSVVKFLNDNPQLFSEPNDKDMWDYCEDEDFEYRDDYDDDDDVDEEYNHQHPWAVYDPQ